MTAVGIHATPAASCQRGETTTGACAALLQDAGGAGSDVTAAAQHWQARLERASERVASLQRKAAARSPSIASLRIGL